MSEPFPPSLGARIAGRFDLLAPLRGEGPARAFLAQDRHTGKRCALSVFDPLRTTAAAWAEYVRITSTAHNAHIPGLAIPPHVPPEPPTPPHIVEDPPSHRALDRLLVQERRIPWQRALIIVERVAGVLHAAHAATQTPHRALTPYRITVDLRDEVQVLDLGVAEFDLPGDPAEEPDYRAPEQRDRKADAAADIYTLALILHGLVSGTALANQPPPPLGSVASVPPALDSMLASCLATNPEQRPNLTTLQTRMRELLGLPALPASDQPAAPPSTPPAAPTGSTPSPPLAPAPIRPPAAITTPAPKRPVAHASRLAPSVSQRSVVAPTAERTEVLANHHPPQDTTLILPTHDDPPTEQLPRSSIPHPNPYPSAALPSAPTPADDPADERTSLFTRAPRRRSPLPDRTEVMPSRRASNHAAALDPTEVLPPVQTQTPAAAPERTERVNLRPANANLSRPTPLRPAQHIDADELTLASPIRLPQRPQASEKAPPSAISRAPTPTAALNNSPPSAIHAPVQPSSTLLRLIICLAIALVLALVFIASQ